MEKLWYSSCSNMVFPSCRDIRPLKERLRGEGASDVGNKLNENDLESRIAGELTVNAQIWRNQS